MKEERVHIHHTETLHATKYPPSETLGWYPSLEILGRSSKLACKNDNAAIKCKTDNTSYQALDIAVS